MINRRDVLKAGMMTAILPTFPVTDGADRIYEELSKNFNYGAKPNVCYFFEYKPSYYVVCLDDDRPIGKFFRTEPIYNLLEAHTICERISQRYTLKYNKNYFQKTFIEILSKPLLYNKEWRNQS